MQLRLRQGVEVAAGVDQQQVALVPEQLDEGRRALIGWQLERPRRLGGAAAGASRRRQRAQRGPAEPEGLVQQAPAVERGRNDGAVSRLSAIDFAAPQPPVQLERVLERPAPLRRGP